MQLTVLAKRAFPKFKTRLAIRRAAFFPLDVYDRLTGKRDPLTPPRGLWFVGGGHFRDNQFLNSFVELCDLQPNHRVLDVGCGIGKQAVPLTRYLDANRGGSYEGFDIVEEGVVWCQREISSRYPNFRFRHVDVYNKHYNPEGKTQPAQWGFPYSDGEFDFTWLVSVFTHMLPDSVQNYIKEVGRILKPGAQCFISFFLLNQESRRAIGERQASLPISYEFENYSVLDPEFPETTVGLAEDFVKECFSRVGLEIKTVHYGAWSGRRGTRFYQDIVIATRR